MSTFEQTSASTFRAGPLVNIPELLLELGCDPNLIFERAGVEQSAFADPENRISYLLGGELLTECVAATGHDRFGFLLGRKANPAHLGIPGFLLRAASTVGQALTALVENLDLHDEGGTSTLQTDADYSRLSFHVHLRQVKSPEQIYDMSAVIMYKIMRSLCGENWKASEVTLPRRKPKESASYLRYFEAPVTFNSESCSILFSSECLQLRPPSANELLFEQLSLEADTLHKTQHSELADTLPAVLQRGLVLDQYSSVEIADVYGVNVRTLHRRLRSAGSSFREQLDHVRESVSLQLLGSTSIPICDIATSLGYSDSTSFIRAFRRWTGSSPARWRRQNNPR